MQPLPADGAAGGGGGVAVVGALAVAADARD